ncbi:MAG: CotH kinase family protein, partial [Oscillospiraceae bacterium]|nr:CotH kinase family protein [Oscillospiraceae bacterium]
MKQKILSLVVLCAMAMSIFVTDTPFTKAGLSFLTTDVSAEPPQDPDDERRVRVIVYYNDTPIASSRDRDIGYDFDSFVKGGEIKLRAYDADGNFLPGATIYYSTSDVGGSGFPTGTLFPNTGVTSDWSVTMTATTVFSRHDGGTIPGPTSTPSSKSGMGEVKISVPTSSVTENREIFTVSAMATPPPASTFRESHVVTRSVILTGNRWQGGEYMVFSIYTDARGIWGHGNSSNTDGILVPGRERERWNTEWNALNGSRPNFADYGVEQEFFAPTLPANYNLRGRGAERPAFAEMFDPNTGYRHIMQSVGIRVKGGWSRGTIPIEQRTLELYARNDYNQYCRGGENTFYFPLFGEISVMEKGPNAGNLQHRYRRFRVRNGGSDREQGHIRDELGAELWNRAGMPLTQNYRPSAVFLNGAYYGLTFMKMPRTENAWMRALGGDTDRFHHIGSKENATGSCYNPGCDRVLAGIPKCSHSRVACYGSSTSNNIEDSNCSNGATNCSAAEGASHRKASRCACSSSDSYTHTSSGVKIEPPTARVPFVRAKANDGTERNFYRPITC